MSTLDGQLYIDAVIVKGIGRTLTASIEHRNEDDTDFEIFSLNPYDIRFRVLGSADGNGQVLIEKIIGHDTDESTIGLIANDGETGTFSFTITADDTNFLGLGSKPISIELLDRETLQPVINLTEGGVAQGEFSKITIIRP